MPRSSIAARQRASPLTTSATVSMSPATRPGWPYGESFVATAGGRRRRAVVTRHDRLATRRRWRRRGAPRRPGGRSGRPAPRPGRRACRGSTSWTSANRTCSPSNPSPVRGSPGTPASRRPSTGRAGGHRRRSRRQRWLRSSCRPDRNRVSDAPRSRSPGRNRKPGRVPGRLPGWGSAQAEAAGAGRPGAVADVVADALGDDDLLLAGGQVGVRTSLSGHSDHRTPLFPFSRDFVSSQLWISVQPLWTPPSTLRFPPFGPSFPAVVAFMK